MQTSLAAAPRVRTAEDHSKLKLPFPPANNGLMMEVVSLLLRFFSLFSFSLFSAALSFPALKGGGRC
ncbi:UNVERIFIED_CONTAM: hypothetical protein PYX00_008553 [Menopon gallinae]|uniref:Transmembrane protein n=1 Tax=Menopon gallinae TaxID=328185 RepID=A0AAW2HNF9_9NEOP